MGRALQRTTGVNDPANRMRAKLRGCAVRTFKQIGKAAVVAFCFLVTVSTLHRWVQLEACGSALGNKPKSSRKRKLTADQQGKLQTMAVIRETGPAKLAAAAYKKDTGIDASRQRGAFSQKMGTPTENTGRCPCCPTPTGSGGLTLRQGI